jgi:flagellar assembly protein FliH
MSTVIKKGEKGELLRRLVSFDLADHLAEARQVVAAAEREAQRIVAQAKRDSVRMRNEAQQLGQDQGRRAGLAEGLDEGRARGLVEATERFNTEHAGLAASMAAVIESIDAQKRDLLIQANRDLLEFAVALAHKVTRGIGEVNRQVALASAEEALRLVGKQTDLTVRINPRDVDTMQRFATELADKLGEKQHLTITEDESIAPGGAVVIAGGMEVDASIETQLEQVTALLLGSEK